MAFLDAGPHFQIELTAEEMLTISQDISLKFSPNAASIRDNEDFLAGIYRYTGPETGNDDANTPLYSLHDGDSGFSSKELNDISEEISRLFTPKAALAEPELFLLPVDPDHLYAYWDIGENQASPIREKAVVKPLILRVYWRPDANPEIKSSNVWFDVVADNPENRQKVPLPIDDTAYSATLGKLNSDNSLDVIATSNIIHVPPAPGRMRTTSPRRDQNAALNGPHSPTAPDSPNQTDHADYGLLDETALIDAEFNGMLYIGQRSHNPFPEQGWYVKLDFSPPSADTGDGTKISSELMDILRAKGIGVELIPEPDFTKQSDYLGKNASGKGL